MIQQTIHALVLLHGRTSRVRWKLLSNGLKTKRDRNKRWLSRKRFLLERCGICVHFSDIHRNYFSAWKYVTKQDKEFVESPGHPDLSDGLPKTTKASFANKPHSTVRQGAESVRHDSTDCNEETSQGRGQKNNINSNHKKRMSSYERAEL